MTRDQSSASVNGTRKTAARGPAFCELVAVTMRKELPDQWLWFDIDLEKVPDYEVWKPESLEWAMGVDWVKVNDLVRHNLTDYPTDDHAAAIRSGRAAGLSSADLGGLSSLYREPIYATTPQITSGGHRITAMRAQGVRWALGQCDRDAVDDGTGGTIDEIHVYIP